MGKGNCEAADEWAGRGVNTAGGVHGEYEKVGVWGAGCIFGPVSSIAVCQSCQLWVLLAAEFYSFKDVVQRVLFVAIAQMLGLRKPSLSHSGQLLR